mgnify:CR=1 FL=1
MTYVCGVFFFFKQKTASEFWYGLVGSEMCIRDRAWAEHGHLGGQPPRCDLAAERLLADVLVNSSRDGMVDAAHDLAEGGLAQALVESCLRYGIGARVWLDELCERAGVFAELARAKALPLDTTVLVDIARERDIPWMKGDRPPFESLGTQRIRRNGALRLGYGIEKTFGFRIKNEDEIAGVDTVVHGEEGYVLADRIA